MPWTRRSVPPIPFMGERYRGIGRATVARRRAHGRGLVPRTGHREHGLRRLHGVAVRSALQRPVRQGVGPGGHRLQPGGPGRDLARRGARPQHAPAVHGARSAGRGDRDRLRADDPRAGADEEPPSVQPGRAADHLLAEPDQVSRLRPGLGRTVHDHPGLVHVRHLPPALHDEPSGPRRRVRDERGCRRRHQLHRHLHGRQRVRRLALRQAGQAQDPRGRLDPHLRPGDLPAAARGHGRRLLRDRRDHDDVHPRREEVER